MDSLLSNLFGEDESEARKVGKATDFVRRYNDGPPEENISGEEAVDNYQRIAGKLSPEQLEEASTEAFERMSPEQRKQLGGLLKQSGGAPDFDPEDPRQLAHAATAFQSSQPNGLAGLFGLGGGSAAAQQGGASDILGNPMVKAALGGIAAIAMKKFLGGSGGGLGSLIGGLIGGGGGGSSRASSQAGATGGGIDDFLGGLIGGGGGGSQQPRGGGGLEDIIGGLIGGGSGGSQQRPGGGGGSLEDLIGGLIGGSGGGDRQDRGNERDTRLDDVPDERKRRML